MWEENELRSNAHDQCQNLLGGAWSNISSEEMGLSHLRGGMSDRIYLCCLPADVETTGDEPRDVLLRIYGKRVSSDMTLVKDSIIFLLLAERNLGPRLYGIFPSGRLEEYIPSRCSTWKDLRQPEVSVSIAKELARTHALRVPIKKKPTWLLEQMRSWRDFLVNNSSVKELKSSHKDIATEALNMDLEKEIDWLENQILAVKSPAVFSHNDLHGGNILLLNNREENGKSLVFIDYELSCYNYRGFDIGMHFCEWCFSYTEEDYPHFSFDMEKFPNEKQQRTFIRAYVKQMEEIQKNEMSVSLEEDIVNEVLLFASSAHMMWALWAFYMALTSSITFGYWEYGKTRLETYFCLKNKYLTSRKSSSSVKVKSSETTEHLKNLRNPEDSEKSNYKSSN